MAYISNNPWTGRTMATFPHMADREIEDIVSAAGEAFRKWRHVPALERCGLLRSMADQLKSRRREVAEIMASEMGKPVSQGMAEADKCALLCSWYADHAAGMLKPERRESSARESYVYYEPQGIILGIMPWNFPFWQVFRFIVPVLTGGNGALLKHASNVPRCAVAIEEIVRASGYPDGLFRTLFPTHDQVSALISLPLVRGVSLTGSNTAGSSVAALAGKNLKKVVMELGGSDPFIVFPEASLEKAVDAAVFSRFQNCGQSCIAAKRLIIHADIYEAFRARLIDKVLSLKTGDPLDNSTDVGPMVTSSAADELERQLDLTLRAGAKLLCGGRDPDAGQAVFLPSVVDQVPVTAPLACEEVFGPIVPLFTFESVAEAVKMANDTPYGLGAAVWTSDELLALDVARQIDTGTVAINGFVKSEPGLPFGGVKESGFGRELAVEGLREFMNIKTISIF